MKQPPSILASVGVIATLIAAGVRHVVTCPGSRNAPLLYAAAAAQDLGLLTLHPRSDERVAGFHGLGLSLGDGHRPVAVLVTSGTAVANLHPAMVEAAHAGVPLLAISADRPEELHGTGANQTTDHYGMFSPAVPTVQLQATDLGAAAQGVSMAVAAEAIAAAVRHRHQLMPVHLNIELRDPLVPTVAVDTDAMVALRATLQDAIIAAERTYAATSAVDPAGVTAEQIDPAPLTIDRTVVVAGHDAGPGAGALATAMGWPLIAEVTSNSGRAPHWVESYRTAIVDQLERGAQIDQIIVIGRPTLSRELTRLLTLPTAKLIAIAQQYGGVDKWANPLGRAAMTLDAVPANWLVPRPKSSRREAFALSWSPDAASRQQRRDAASWDGRAVAAVVAQTADVRDLLVLGPSGPIRLIDDQPEPARATVLANRGLSGIDGVISTAYGAAQVWSGGAVRALMGDLTFLHDLNALQTGAGEPVPSLQIVVVNDRGGTIFAGLEHGDVARSGAHAARAVDRLLTTVPQADIGALCAGYSVRHVQVLDASALEAAIRTPARGITVIEALVSKTSTTS